MGNAFKAVLAGGSGNKVIVTCAPQFAGATITCTNNTKTYTKICPSTSPYTVEFKGLDAGTWTISGTIQGTVFTTTVEVQDVSAVLSYGFVWTTWVDTASQLDSTDYNTLDELLEDEEAVRELMLEHACVDYMSSFSNVTPNLEKVIENDICAKWINLCDYALDTCYANAVLKAVMDEVDKYGYGEWALVGQVPKMTSNTAPYGEASASSEYSSSWRAWQGFNDTTTNGWAPSASDSFGNAYIEYDFINPICVKSVKMVTSPWGDPTQFSLNRVQTYQLQGYNGTDWENIGDVADRGGVDVTTTIIAVDNSQSYSKYRVVVLSGDLIDRVEITYLQFYAWAPKGNVPIMTANNAPYGVASASSNASGYEPYKAFDGNYGTNYSASSATTSADLIYKFVNPTCVKKFLYYIKTTGATLTLHGSNDGTNYSNALATVSSSTPDSNQYVDVTNDDYYLYYKLHMTRSSNTQFPVVALQFYGRELSDLVPPMISNTLPSGEASGSGTVSTGSPYQVFDKDPTTNYGHNKSSNSDIGYTTYHFPRPVIAKSFYIWMAGTGYAGSTFDVEASTDGTNYTPILSNGTITSNGDYYNALATNDTEYSYFRVHEKTGYLNAGKYYFNMREIKFYGLDYSEKEFEEGTTKKWLYDHGVELEEMTAKVVGTATTIKETDNLHIKVGAVVSSGCGFASPQIDLTPYDLLRGKVGDIVASSAQAANLSTSTTDNVDGSGIVSVVGINQGSSYLPNNIALDISTDDQNMYVFFRTSLNASSSAGAVARECTLKELWLE